MRGVADRAGDFAEAHALGRGTKAGDVALVFGKPVGDFQAEGNGFGVDAVGAADLWSVLEFVGAQIENFAEEDKVALDNVRSISQKEGLGGVHDIVGGHAVVEPARGIGISYGLAHGHSEGDDIVFDTGFQFVYASDIYLGAGAQDRGGFFGHLAGFGERFGGGELDVEPFLVAIEVAPDAAHFFTRIAWNHVRTSPRWLLL